MTFPRVCGGDPKSALAYWRELGFSPRVRG